MATAAGVALSVIKPWRYRGSTRGLYESLQRGDIGDVRMISLWWLYPRIPFIGKEWFRDPKEGGLFLDAGSHCFDYMRWVAGAEQAFTPAELPGSLDEPGRLVLVRRLVREGLLRISEA